MGLLFDGSDGIVGKKDKMYMYRGKLETVVTIYSSKKPSAITFPPIRIHCFQKFIVLIYHFGEISSNYHKN